MHNVTEEHLEVICVRCNTKHENMWEDEWSKKRHYRETTCSKCNYRTRIPSEIATSSLHH
ncbi:MAG: hypothetical protein KKG59_04670 [Nanoarchaeota archaeon]|nr:hypothetical protein [Nanoarchaeota archaeon]